MLGSRVYLIALLVAFTITIISSMWFSKQVDQNLYVQEMFVPPSVIEIGYKVLEVPDDFILMTWPSETPRYQHYDIRMRSQLSRSRLRYGAGLTNDLVQQRQRCAGETVDAFLISCDETSIDADSAPTFNIESAYWHIFNSISGDGDHLWYSATIVLFNKNIMWFEGEQDDCLILAELLADAIDVDPSWFCQVP